MTQRHYQAVEIKYNDELGQVTEELFRLLQIHLSLEWRYEECAETNNEMSAVEADVIPPLAEMETLLDLAKSGKMRKIREYADCLMKQDDKYISFATKLQNLARNFQEKAILALLKQYQGEIQ